jgi:hypothetical protein
MIQGHDHTIFFVIDPAELDAVAQRFVEAGFLLTERDDAGKETAATAQKLVCFADGSYVEILTVRDAAARARHRFAHLLPLGDGWADYSLYTDTLDADCARMTAASRPLGGPHDHTKALRDGRPWGVRLVLTGIGAGGLPALPFLLQDKVGRDLRIPRVHIDHPNGITGTAGVTVGVHALAAAQPQFATLLGDGMTVGPTGGSNRVMRFRVGRQWVDVAEAPETDSALRRHLARRGEGMVSVTFAKPGTGAAQPLDLRLGDAAAAFVAEA